MEDLERRARVHGALSDPSRLRIVDALSVGDAAPKELQLLLEMSSSLLAHHVNILEREGLVLRRSSQGDKRRSYLTLVRGAWYDLQPAPAPAPRMTARVVFVCTANSARSQLAAALWRRHSAVPATSAGTHPTDRIAPGAVAVARRHRLPLGSVRPRSLGEVVAGGDLVVTVCDSAHEELEGAVGHLEPAPELHWSVEDPVLIGTDDAFDKAFEDLTLRVTVLATRVTAPTKGVSA